MAISRLGGRLLLAILVISVPLLIPACSARREYSADLRGYRVYVVRVQRLDRLLVDQTEVQSGKGFVYVVVELVVENITKKVWRPPLSWEFSLRGKTASGDYVYQSSYDTSYDSQYWESSLYEPLPPGFRTRIVKVFQAAEITQDLRLEIREKTTGFFDYWSHPFGLGLQKVSMPLPAPNKEHPVTMPCDKSKLTYLKSLNERFSLEDSPAVVEDIGRQGGELTLQLRVENTTGYSIDPCRNILVISRDGLVVEGSNYNHASFGVVPGQTGTGSCGFAPLDTTERFPDDLAGAFLVMVLDDSKGKLVAFDLSGVR